MCFCLECLWSHEIARNPPPSAFPVFHIIAKAGEFTKSKDVFHIAGETEGLVSEAARASHCKVVKFEFRVSFLFLQSHKFQCGTQASSVHLVISASWSPDLQMPQHIKFGITLSKYESHSNHSVLQRLQREKTFRQSCVLRVLLYKLL